MEAYASLITAAAAIDLAKSADASAIRDALRQISLPDTPFGPVKFDSKGQNQHPVLITQILGGQYKVVWPPDAAEAKPVIPAPPWNKR